MHIAEGLTKIPPYLFMTLRNKINDAKARGVDVVNLAIGAPVEPTPDLVIEALYTAAKDPANHRYPTDKESGMLASPRRLLVGAGMHPGGIQVFLYG